MKNDPSICQETILSGLGVSPGIAIGPAYVVETGAPQVPDYVLVPDALDSERSRFVEATAKARRQIRRMKTQVERLPDAAAEEIGFLLDAHIAMLTNSRLTRGVEQRIMNQRVNAESAVQAEITAIASSFAETKDRFLAARIADVREVGMRILRCLIQAEYQAFSLVPAGHLVIAEELTPAETALLNPTRIAGFATELGGAEGHTAIMARSLGVPAVLGVSGLTSAIRSGDPIIVDGLNGRVLVNPSDQVLADYRRHLEAWHAEREELRSLNRVPAVTRDGIGIELFANIELPREVEQALEVGAEGIGLMRTEFLFMNRSTLPDEQEQYETLREVVEGMRGRVVTARTVDLGGEKLAAALGGRFGESTNPALGLRAIRLGLREPKLLETQLAAMLRASAHGPIRILLPLICTAAEVRRVRELLAVVARRLRRRGLAIAEPPPPLGVMIEVPGAALAADSLARVADFFAIGTNDLTQYTLAIDRGDEQVATLYDPLHPAVLRLIQFSIEAALRARLPVSICGEIAGDPRFTALLLGLGVRELSMVANRIPSVKRRIRSLSLTAASHRTQMIMAESESGRIAGLLDGFNKAPNGESAL